MTDWQGHAPEAAATAAEAVPFWVPLAAAVALHGLVGGALWGWPGPAPERSAERIITVSLRSLPPTAPVVPRQAAEPSSAPVDKAVPEPAQPPAPVRTAAPEPVQPPAPARAVAPEPVQPPAPARTAAPELVREQAASLQRVPRAVKPPEPARKPLAPSVAQVAVQSVSAIKPVPVPEAEPPGPPAPASAPSVAQASPAPASAPSGTRASSWAPSWTLGGQWTPAPEYPAQARRSRMEGRVVLRVLVGLSGGVMNVHVVSSSGWPLLDTRASETVRRWRFEAAPSGATSPAVVTVPVTFRLR